MNKGNLLILCVSSAIGLLLLEFGIRLLTPQELVRPYFQPDAQLGVTPQANLDYFDSYDMPFYEHHIRTNAIGARMDEQVDLSPNTQRILITGDSFAFGLGAERQDSFVGMLQNMLRSKNPTQPIQLINMGIPSYSNGHVRKQVPLLLPTTQPQKVLYFINSNDLNDNFNTDGSHSIYHVEFHKDGSIQTGPKLAYSELNRFLLLKTPYPWLGKNSHLWMLLKKSILKDFGAIQKAKALHKTPEKLITLALHHVQHLATFLQEKNIPLQIIWISHQCQLRLTDGPECDINYNLFENDLGTLAQKNKGVSFFSATPGLTQKMESQKLAVHFFPDRHFNLKGYQVFTEIVYPTVENFVTSKK